MARPALGQYGLPPRARHLPAIGLGRLVVFLYTTLLAHGLKRKIAVIVDGRQRAIEHRNREKREQVRTFRRTESEGRRGEGGASPFWPCWLRPLGRAARSTEKASMAPVEKETFRRRLVEPGEVGRGG